MKQYTYIYENEKPKIDLSEFSDKSDLLFFDIETTGLSPATSFIYLIGAGFYKENGFTVMQWFAESMLEERLIINEFFKFASSFTTLMHFNGQKFDIPFVEKRCIRYKIPCYISQMNSFDIYRLIKPYKSVLGLSDLRQKTIEIFLHIDRYDMYDGGQLIPVYQKYSQRPDDKLLELLLLHNKEDVYNMTNLLTILKYRNIDRLKFTCKDLSTHSYKDYNGEENSEILISGSHDFDIPIPVKSLKNNIYISISNNGKMNIRIPVKNCELKDYFPDYKNYYYLPVEDTIVHKSVASAVAKENRKNATKANCYIKAVSDFIQYYECDRLLLFKTDLKSKENYIRLEDFNNLSTDEINQFVTQLIKYFI